MLAPLLLLAALASWALSSPVGSTADEDFHLVSIWCGAGDRDGVCETGGSPDGGAVPFLVPDVNCYIGDHVASGECQELQEAEGEQPLEFTVRGNFSDIYPPVFYRTMHVLVGPDVYDSVVAMRAANALLFVTLVTALALLLPRGRRVVLAAGLLVSATPLAMSLISSINPSGWSAFSAAVVFLALAGFYETAGPRRVLLAVLAVLAALMGAGARADTAAYVGVAAVAATVVAWRPGGRRWADPLIVAVVGALAVYFFLGSRQSGAVAVNESAAAPAAATGGEDAMGPGTLLWDNALEVPSLWAGIFGAGRLGGLGSFDTNLPGVVWVLGGAAFAGVVFLGLGHLHWRKATALVLTLALLWVLPMLLLYGSGSVVGENVQPRYLLPLVALFAMVAMWRPRGSAPAFTAGQAAVLAAALTVVNSIALHTNIRRYVTGEDVTGFNLDIAWEWWPLPVSPMVLWLTGSAAYLGFTALVALLALTPGAARREVPATVAAGRAESVDARPDTGADARPNTGADADADARPDAGPAGLHRLPAEDGATVPATARRDHDRPGEREARR